MERQSVNKQSIQNLPEKLNALCIAATKNRNFKDLIGHKKGEKTGITARTLENWSSGKIDPHPSKLSKFSDMLGLDFLWWKLELNEFCEKIANKYGINAEELHSNAIRHISNAESSILGLITSAHSSKWVREDFESIFRGYWWVYHYWEKEEQKDSTEKYIFRHLINFYKYNSKTNTIVFNLASARQQNISWNYLGNLIISQSKLYFLTQTTIKSEIEVLLIVANKPFQHKDTIKGILLASTPARESDGIISRPAACRVLLKKIHPKNEEEDCKEYFNDVKIIPKSEITDNELDDIDLIENTINSKVGILFPKYANISES